MERRTKNVWIVFASGVGLGGVIILCVYLRYAIFPPPPGYSIAALGVVTLIMTLVLPKEPTKSQKAAWILAAFVLMFVEMWAVSHDRRQQEIQHTAELRRQQQLFDASLQHLGVIEVGIQGIPRIQNAISSIKPSIVTNVLSPPSVGNLKQRCNLLASAITNLIAHRYDQLSKYPQPPTRDDLSKWLKSNDEEFRSVAYGNQVQAAKELRDELAGIHLRDPQLDRILSDDDENLASAKGDPRFAWTALMTIETMREVANRLAALANRIP